MPSSIKALTHDAYGSADVIKLSDIEAPTVGDDDVLVRIRAASINPYDWHFLRGQPYVMRLQFGLSAPKSGRLGADLAGVVEAVGKNVTSVKVGAEVIGLHHGAFAELLCVKANELGPKPSNLSFEEAATLPMAALTALQGLRDGQVKAGQRVLIVGASGGVGSIAVQLAKHLGAHVTGVCGPRNVEFVRSLGADDVIDYTKEDFTERTGAFDVVFQLAGTTAATTCLKALNATGALVLSSGDDEGKWLGPISRLLAAVAARPFVSQRLCILDTKPTSADLQHISELVERGVIRTVVDRVVPLTEAAQAIVEVEKGHTRGKISVRIGA